MEILKNNQIKLTGDEAADVVWNGAEDWEEVVGTRQIIDKRRWAYVSTAVFIYKPSGRFYKFVWSQGATESQDEQPYDCNAFYTPIEVQSKIMTINEWVPVHG